MSNERTVEAREKLIDDINEMNNKIGTLINGQPLTVVLNSTLMIFASALAEMKDKEDLKDMVKHARKVILIAATSSLSRTAEGGVYNPTGMTLQ